MGWACGIKSVKSKRNRRMKTAENDKWKVEKSNNQQCDAKNISKKEAFSSNLSLYSKAAQQFIQTQEFKRLAKENCLNLHGKLIHSKFSVAMKSIELKQDENCKNMYSLTFSYSATENVWIEVYFWATQMTNPEGLPVNFFIPQNLPEAIEIEAEKGIDVEIKEYEIIFDIKDYEGVPLFSSSYSYFPCIITLSSLGIQKILETGLSDFQRLITYWVFKIDPASNILQILPHKQVMVAFEMGFSLQQIYGINDALDNNMSNDGKTIDKDDQEDQLCIIWFDQEKNTIVMPCGHLCLCKDCAIKLSNSAENDWPVCRVKVESYVPLNITNIKKMEQQESAEPNAATADEANGFNASFEEGYEVLD